MAWGLEARVPFLDHELVELASQMPSKYKVGSQGAKHILKTIARGKIPDAVIDRPKGYFPMPALKYVRGEFLDMMKDLKSTIEAEIAKGKSEDDVTTNESLTKTYDDLGYSWRFITSERIRKTFYNSLKK